VACGCLKPIALEHPASVVVPTAAAGERKKEWRESFPPDLAAVAAQCLLWSNNELQLLPAALAGTQTHSRGTPGHLRSTCFLNSGYSSMSREKYNCAYCRSKLRGPVTWKRCPCKISTQHECLKKIQGLRGQEAAGAKGS
jgi:hypothetical protein